VVSDAEFFAILFQGNPSDIATIKTQGFPSSRRKAVAGESARYVSGAAELHQIKIRRERKGLPDAAGCGATCKGKRKSPAVPGF
jgi:hypothetical protein